MTTRTRQQGPHKISDSELRTHCISVRLNDKELSILESKRGKLARGEWLRVAYLDKLPRIKQPKELEFIDATNAVYMRLNKLLGAVGAIIKLDKTLTQDQLYFLTELKKSVNYLQTELMRVKQ